jgi:hypothetical protein
MEFVIGDLYLEPYQVPGKKQEKLSKYDKFYRVVCDPFHVIYAVDFFKEIDSLIDACETEFETNNPGARFNLEHIPYVKFLEYFKERP